MRTQQEIAFADAAARAGDRFEVLVDRRASKGRAVARHAGQTPEVDAVTYVLSGRVRPGQFVEVHCEGSKGYDLIARPCDAILPASSRHPDKPAGDRTVG